MSLSSRWLSRAGFVSVVFRSAGRTSWTPRFLRWRQKNTRSSDPRATRGFGLPVLGGASNSNTQLAATELHKRKQQQQGRARANIDTAQGWGGVSSLLSWPSPMRQPRNARALTGSRAVLTALSALGSAWAATALPAPPPTGGGGPFRFISRSILLLPCLPLTNPLDVRLRVSPSPPPVLIALLIVLLILLHTTYYHIPPVRPAPLKCWAARPQRAASNNNTQLATTGLRKRKQQQQQQQQGSPRTSIDTAQQQYKAARQHS